jgi:hypothetical protein
MRLMDDSIPFTEGGELIVDISVDARGTGDVRIMQFDANVQPSLP